MEGLEDSLQLAPVGDVGPAEPEADAVHVVVLQLTPVVVMRVRACSSHSTKLYMMFYSVVLYVGGVSNYQE